MRVRLVSTMRRLSARYSVELVIGLLGAVAAAAEAIAVRRVDIAVLLAFISALLAISVAAIRQDIDRLLGQNSIPALLERISEPRWRKQAEADFERVCDQLRSWADGHRRVPVGESLRYQIGEVTRATTSVRAIHVALDAQSLAMLSDSQRGFHGFLDSYKRLPTHVEKRRILVLDESDGAISAFQNGVRVIVSDEIKRVIAHQQDPVSDGGLGFTLRILWMHPRTRTIADLLVIDDRTSCSIQSFGNGQFGDLDVCISPHGVEDAVRRFENAWTDAVPAGLFLAESEGSGA